MFDNYRTARVDRDGGIVTITVHSRGDSLIWGALPHRELADLFGVLARDRDMSVLVITGNGKDFIRLPDGGAGPLSRGDIDPQQWDVVIREGNRLIHNMLDVEVPVIAAVNGPVHVHAEVALLADIVLAADTASFADHAHFPGGLVPGDGMQVLWPALLGPNRGRYFLLTGEVIDAEEAKRLGVVAEVLAPQALLPRAREHADALARLNPMLLRNTRSVLTRPWKRAMADDLHTGLALEAITSLSGKQFYAAPDDDDEHDEGDS